jgi:Glycosyl transferase family 2
VLAVVVVCHGDYLRWLPAALQSIDRQRPRPTERVVVFDGCDIPTDLGPGWRAFRGDWGHPSSARNRGLAETVSPWVIFCDADNIMAPGHIEAVQRAVASAPSDVGIIYSDIQYCDESLRLLNKWPTPDWDYWSLRAENYIDTASVWRREAVDLAGGWSTRSSCFEDYALALDVTEAGWKAQHRPGPPIMMRAHPGSRSAAQDRNNVWRCRSLAVVSLLAGRESTFPIWEEFLLKAELPPKTALYVVDNSGSPGFTALASSACNRLAAERGFTHVDFQSVGSRYEPAPGEPYMNRDRHLHIARLYTGVIPRVREDLLLTLEDDIAPPLNAVRLLGEQIGCPSWGRYGAVGAAYDMGDGFLCGGRDDGGWGSPIAWDNLPFEAIDAGCVGGACTMWANWALSRQPVNFWWDQGLGWDGSLCTQMHRRGFGVRIHGDVRCVHHLQGALRN